MKITAAEALVRCLENEQVEVVFGYPGGAILPVYDMLYDSGMRHVLARHEQGAVHAADGYARVSGRVGVCMATSGPGATNLVTGIANAYMDSVPMVLFTGQVPTTMVGTDSFQEVDITGISMPVTKHNYLIKEARQLPQIIKNAFHIASTGRPGPVLIDIPKDVAESEIYFEYPSQVKLWGYSPTYRGHPQKINEAVSAIQQSKRPVIYAGGGILNSGALEDLRNFAEIINAPVTNTFMGLSSFSGSHPLYLGMLGLHGSRYANRAISECDLLIALGARFDDRVTGKIAEFAPHAKVIHADIDPAEIGKNVLVDIPIVGDVKRILRAFNARLEPRENKEWVETVQQWKKDYPVTYKQDDNMLKPQYVIEKIYEHTGGNATIATDVGQHQMWVAQFYSFNRPRGLVSSGGLGCMGFGLPSAMGAQIGIPGEQVALVTSEGSFQMTMQEMATIVEQNLPVKIFILNNDSLGMVRQLQEVYCNKRYMATNLKFVPDFEVFARAYGVSAFSASSNEEVDKVVPEAFNTPGPVVVNCKVHQDENVTPMVLAGKGISNAIDV